MTEHKLQNLESIDMFWKFSDSYHTTHGWLSSAVLIFGLTSNTLNIMVLTRPNMVIFCFILVVVYSILKVFKFMIILGIRIF